MDRAQFMQQLEKLLFDISDAERQEALEYYESYFDDAGKDQESDVIRELGTPDKVAAIIKADLKESNDRYAEYTELGYEDTRTREPGQMPDKYTAITRTGRSGSTEKEAQDKDGTHQTYEGNFTNGRKFGRDRARGRFEQAFGRAGEQMGEAFGRAGEQMGQAFSRAGEHMDQAFNQAGEQFDQARSRAEEQFGQAFSQAGEQFDRARDRAEENYGRARSRAQERHERERKRAEERRERAGNHEDQYRYGEERKNHTGMIFLLIILVFASPFIPGAVGGILGVVLTILCLPFLLIFGFGSAAIGVLAGAVGTIAGGIGLCFGSPAAGILTIGVGCLLMALSIVLGIITIWIAGRILPWLFGKIKDFCQRLFHRGRKDGEGI